LIEAYPEDTGSAGSQSARPHELGTAVAGAPRKPGVLVVDDDITVRTMLGMGLRQCGFSIWQAANGHEALQIYAEHASEIDVVLLDVRMPGLDGPQTLTAFRQLDPRIPCCFISGQTGEYTKEALLRMGAAHFFLKPCSLTEIVPILQRLVSPTPSR